MDNSRTKYKTLITVLIVVNAVAMFLFAGMPKALTSRHHFIDYGGVDYNLKSKTYLSNTELTLTDAQGNDVFVPADTRITISLNSLINRILDDQDDNVVTIYIGSDETGVDVDYSVFSDEEKFKDISEEVRLEYDKEVRKAEEEGNKRFQEYLLKEHLWFIFPAEHPSYFAAGLILALVSVLAGILIKLLSKNRLPAVFILSLLILIKITAIVLLYIHPSYCH